MNRKKLLGQVFTKEYVIGDMLELYKGNWLESKIIEPSFGEGAFILEIFKRIIDEGRNKGLSDSKIAKIIEKNFLGYETEKKFYENALEEIPMNLEKKKGFSEKINLKKILKNKSIFLLDDKQKFDLIIGNPPYVRIQNFTKGIKEIQKKLDLVSGNTDLFLIFINFLLPKLNKDGGEFIFIVPNSLGKSKAALKIRKYLTENGHLKYFDYEAADLFSYVSVYSCIFWFKIDNSFNKKHEFLYHRSKTSKKIPIYSKKIHSYKFFEPYIKFNLIDNLNIKNGVATLADKIFIHKEKLDIEKRHLLRAYKGSRWNKNFYIIFPYKIEKDVVKRFKDEEDFKRSAPKTFAYLKKFKSRLQNRSLEKNIKWFEFGRSQALNDITKQKWIIDTLIRPNQKELKIKPLEKNAVVFSGLYTTNENIFKINNEKLIKWLRFKAKDMRGGYKKISSSLFKI